MRTRQPNRIDWHRLSGVGMSALSGRFVLVLLALFFSSMPAAAPANFEQGMNAMLEGNYAEAYCRWKPLAERGNADAQYNLGWLYANGNGMNVDPVKAVGWWNAAAEQGHADAEFALGLTYTTGEGIRKDLGKAVFWFLRAAKRGHRDARELLSRLSLDPGIDLVDLQPQLLRESWFGWVGAVKGDRINIRAKPSTKGKIVHKGGQGETVRVVGRRGDWLQIVLATESSDSTLAWVYHSLIVPVH